jgi:hypothetical protein
MVLGLRMDPARPRAQDPQHAQSREEIFVQATVYCGIPAGLDAFKVAHEVLEAEGALPVHSNPGGEKA